MGELKAEVDPDCVQLVRLARETWKRRAPFQLPIRVLASGPIAAESVRSLQVEYWLTSDQVMAEFGLNIEVGDLPWNLHGPRIPDIVIADESDAALEAIRELKLEKRPRLLVLPRPSDLRGILEPEIIDGTSCLTFAFQEPADIRSFVTQFLLGLIHDLPLHEAMKAALRSTQVDGDSVFLVSDPEANHDLRLLDALTSIWSEGVALDAEFGWMKERLPAGTMFVPAVELMKERVKEQVFLRRPELRTLGQTLSEVVESAADAKADFEQETEGLQPLAHTGAALESMRSGTQALRESLTSIARDKVVVQALREEQDRRVDIGVERVNAYGLAKDVGKHSSLALNRRYRLRVHIGNLLPGSVMSGEVPPINLLLPDDESGHDLEVAVQPKDFTLLSAATQTLHLPPVGGSEPRYFLLRTPDNYGTATLRVLVYHENHLLQSFLLEARVTAGEEPAPESLNSRLEFSRTERFTNIGSLKPRALSIGANRTGNTHELTIKGTDAKEDVYLPPVTFDGYMKDFRAILNDATFAAPGSDQPRQFPPITPGQPPPEDFANYVRKLARLGNNLYNELFGDTTDGLQRALRELKLRPLPGETDAVVQVVRFHATFAFPWALLYDFDLPPNDKRPVCPGLVPDSAGGSSPCAHGPEDDVFCVKGFWGIRHVIEELLPIPGRRKDEQFTVERQKASGAAVRIAVTPGLAAGKNLTGQLKSRIGTAEVEVGPTDDADLINLLWKDPPERPSVLIILGHLATDPPLFPDEPIDPRIVLVDGSKWLTERRLAQRFQKVIDPWKQPRSLVLLMACESSALGADKINTFVKAFVLAGALAVAGTECIVFSDLAAKFAEEITIALWSDSKRLGGAVTTFRRRLMSSGNPLGFVFHCVGSADLTLSKP